MNIWTLLLFVGGLGLLVGGAEVMVRGASRLAIAIGISPLVVGLTIVSFGTSAPELAVSMQSAWMGNADIALGNVVGSNIFNVLVVLGICAIILPLVVSRQLVRLDVPIMIGVSILMFFMALDGRIGRLDGLILFAGLVGYTTFSIWQSRREKDQIEAATHMSYDEATSRSGGARAMLLNIGLIGVGLALLIVGSDWLVDSAVTIASALGISSLIIGLTVVAIGTSLPEVATSVVAALRGERDIAVGNVVGSCIFNILAILGLTALIGPNGINVAPQALRIDIPIMIIVALTSLPIFFTGFVVVRWEGILLISYYIFYTVVLIVNTINPAILSPFGIAIYLLVGLSVVGLILRGAHRAHGNLRDHGSIMGKEI